MVVQNLDGAVVKKTTVKISAIEASMAATSTTAAQTFGRWPRRQNAQYHSINTSNRQNVTKIHGAKNSIQNTTDTAIADAHGNRDFELLDSHVPFYQSALGIDLNMY